MPYRRVLLCLPEDLSAAAAEFVHDVRAALVPKYQVRLQREGEPIDDDMTPVDGTHKQALVLTIKEPSDDGEGTL